jgi:hypothetical protein
MIPHNKKGADSPFFIDLTGSIPSAAWIATD